MSMDIQGTAGPDGTEDREMARLAAAVGARLRTPVPSELRARQAAAAAAAAVSAPRGRGPRGPRGLRALLVWGGPLALAAGVLGVVVVGPALRGGDDALPLIAAGPTASGPMVAAEAGAAAPGRAVEGTTRPADVPQDLSSWRPTTYTFTLDPAVRLDADAGSAWGFEPPADTATAAADLAALFGLPTPTPTTWDAAVLAAEGPDGAALNVFPAGDWSFSAPLATWPDWSCPDVPPADASVDVVVDCPAPEPTPGLPADAAARSLALDLLRRAGAAEARVTDVFRDDWTVSVALEVPLPGGPAGLGAGAWVTLGRDGEVLSASATLARPVLLGRYPTIDVVSAVARLEADLEATGGPVPLPADVPADVPTDAAAPEVVEVRIVRAELAPSWAWTPDGRMLVVPHVRFTAADGGEWWVVAVEERFLAPA